MYREERKEMKEDDERLKKYRIPYFKLDNLKSKIDTLYTGKSHIATLVISV